VAIVALVVVYREPLLAVFVEPVPDLANKKTFRKEGLSFDHPGNWSQKYEGSSSSGILIDMVTVESPGASTAIVQRYRRVVDVDPQVYVQAFLDEMSKQKEDTHGIVGTDNRSVDTIQGELLGAPAKGKRVRLAVTLLGEKVPTTVEVLTHSTAAQTVVFMTTCSDEDLARVKPGFELIRKSIALDGSAEAPR